MKFTELMDEWKVDSQINRTDLLKEIAGIGKLLYKYQDFYREEASRLVALTKEAKTLRRKLRTYYRGLCDQDQLNDLNRKQYVRVVEKGKIESEIDVDDEFIDIESRVEQQRAKVETLKGIISHLQYTRPKQLTMTLEYLKWTGGME